MRFTKGVNKNVILSMVDTMLANKEVNMRWLPDCIERVLYCEWSMCCVVSA